MCPPAGPAQALFEPVVYTVWLGGPNVRFRTIDPNSGQSACGQYQTLGARRINHIRVRRHGPNRRNREVVKPFSKAGKGVCDMKMRFEGTIDELVVALRHIGLQGTWHPEPNGVFMLRCTNGANLHWSST